MSLHIVTADLTSEYESDKLLSMRFAFSY